jgi:uncharacterized protein DUF2569
VSLAPRMPELAVHVIKPPPLPAKPPPLPGRANLSIASSTITIDQRQPIDPVQKDHPEELVGIGGWLVVIALGRIYGPLALLASLAKYYTSLESGFWITYPFVAYSEVALNAAAFALSLWTTFLFFKKSKSFPTFFIYNAIASVLLLPVDLLLVTATGQSIQQMISLVDAKEGTQWGQGVIGALVWIPYVKMSKRVTNTFVN